MVKFFYNGLKVGDSKDLLKACISYSSLRGSEERVISVYAVGYTSFNNEILKEEFNIINNSDSMTDYFEEDRFYLKRGDKFFKEALKAYYKKTEKDLRLTEKKASGKVGYSLEYYQMLIERDRKELEQLEREIKEL